MYVSLETLQQAVGLVDSLAELDEPASFAGIVLPGLATLVGCDVLTYNEIGPAHGQARYADYPAGALDPATQPVFAAHVHEHPLVNHYRATGSGEPVMISDFLTQQRFHRLGLYAEFFRAIPVEHQMAVSLPGPDQQVIGIAMNRGRRDFSDQDRALLSVLQAPLNAALHRARSRQQARQALTTLADGGFALGRGRSSVLGPVAGGPHHHRLRPGLGGRPADVCQAPRAPLPQLRVRRRGAGVSPITLARRPGETSTAR